MENKILNKLMLIPVNFAPVYWKKNLQESQKKFNYYNVLMADL